MISAIPANPSSGRWAIMDEEINCMSCSRRECYYQRSKGMAWRNTKSEQWDTLHAEYWILCIVVQISRPHSTDDNVHAKRGTPQFCMIISYCACTGLRYTIVWASIVWRFFLGFLMKSDFVNPLTRCLNRCLGRWFFNPYRAQICWGSQWIQALFCSVIDGKLQVKACTCC